MAPPRPQRDECFKDVDWTSCPHTVYSYVAPIDLPLDGTKKNLRLTTLKPATLCSTGPSLRVVMSWHLSTSAPDITQLGNGVRNAGECSKKKTAVFNGEYNLHISRSEGAEME